MGLYFRALGLGGAPLLLAGCGLVTGVGDLQELSCAADCGADGGAADTAPADASGDAPRDASSDIRTEAAGDTSVVDSPASKDAGAQDGPVLGACAQGQTCIPPVPQGWMVVAFDPSSGGSCPTGYGNPTSLIVNPPLGPTTCSCACSVASQPTCTAGTLSLTWGSDPSCNTGPLPLDAMNGSCVSTTLPFAAAYHELPPLPATGGACNGTVTGTPPQGGTQGFACPASGQPGGSCGTGVCAPSPGTLTACISQLGSVGCPPDYPNGYSVGTGVGPGSCPSCNCPDPTATCANATLNVYQDTACTPSALASLPADGNCDAVTGGGNASSYQYSADVQGAACPQPSPTMGGNAVLENPATVCCP